MKFLLKEKIFVIITLLYGIYMFIPLISNSKTIPSYIPPLFVSITLILLYPKALLNRIFLWFCIYILILMIYCMFDKPLTIGNGDMSNWKKIMVECAYFLPTISILSIIIYLDRKDITTYIIICLCVLLLLSSLCLIPQIYDNKNIMRIQLHNPDMIYSLWFPNYSLMHSYVLFLPVTCFFFLKSKKIYKIINLCIIFLLLYIIYNTSITTTAILSLLIIALTFYYNNKFSSKSVIIYVLLFVICLLYLNKNIILTFLDKTSEYYTGTQVEGKINDIRLSIQYEEIMGGNITGRQKLHKDSWLCFISNPLIGRKEVGGHSALLDRLGGLGLLGFVPYLMMIYSSISITIKKEIHDKDILYFYIILFLTFTILQFVKASQGGDFWFIFLVFSPYSMICYKKDFN